MFLFTVCHCELELFSFVGEFWRCSMHLLVPGDGCLVEDDDGRRPGLS